MKRLSVLIILLANLAILVHSAIPHYHGDDMIATICHITDDSDKDIEGHHCHHDGGASHDSGHCQINDTLMAMICREDHNNTAASDIFVAIQITLNSFIEYLPEPEKIILGCGEVIPILKGPFLSVCGLRAPPALLR